MALKWRKIEGQNLSVGVKTEIKTKYDGTSWATIRVYERQTFDIPIPKETLTRLTEKQKNGSLAANLTEVIARLTEQQENC